LGSRGLHHEPLEDRRLLAVLFTESFEGVTAPNPAFWSIPDLQNLGEVVIKTDASVNPGGQSLLFDAATPSAQDQLNEAILNVDLSVATGDPILTFYQLEGQLGTLKNDQDDFLGDVAVVGPGSTRPPESLGDGLSVSIDGVTWYKLEDVRGLDINRIGDGLWQLHEYDLGDNITRINSQFGAGLSLTSNFKIKWSQYDNLGFPNRGWAIDKIKIADSPQFFDANLERNVFHRLDVSTNPDMLFRVGLFGNVDANTPILVSVHGAFREILPHTTLWQQYVANPANGVDSLIVVAPFFSVDGPYQDYGNLAFDTQDNLTADQALLDAVSEVTSTGLGDASQLYMFGFSRGAHFVEAFNYVHPELVASAVVASADRHTFPDPNVAFPHGIGDSVLHPLPAGESFDVNGFLSQRILFWIGDQDLDLTDTSAPANAQGATRPLRMANMFNAVTVAANQAGLTPADHEYELFIRENRDHRFLAQDIPVFFEFLFRDFNPAEAPIEVHPVIVSSPSTQQRSATLPAGLTSISDNQFWIEFWAQSTGSTGIMQGNVEFKFDPAFAQVALLNNGSVFNQSTSGTFNNNSGFIKNFGGTTTLSGVGVGEFALLGRALFQGQASGISGDQVLLALKRGVQPFKLVGDIANRADLLPLAPTLFINSSDQPPVLDPIGSKSTNEGELLTFTATASDGNPGDQLAFSLGAGAPSGASIDPVTGVFQWTPPDDAGSPFTVEVVVTDNSAAMLSDSEMVQIDVSGVAPVLSATGPATGVPGQPRDFTLTAADSAGDAAAGFTFNIDWDGNGVFDETVVGPSGTSVEHIFTDLGSSNVTVQASDKDGLLSNVETLPIDITRIALQADENDPSVTNIAWGGTNGFDAVFFLATGTDRYTVFAPVVGGLFVNDIDVFNNVNGSISIYGQDGINILVSEFVMTPATIVGGSGDDVIVGGFEADLLDGRGGDDLIYGATEFSDGGDTLLGGAGRDVLYGHFGGDSLDGGDGEDLLIAGKLQLDDLVFDLFKIQSEWVSSRDFTTRVLNILGSGSGPHKNGNVFLTPGTTVVDDSAVDTLLGGDGLDWFLYDFSEDIALDFQINEVRHDIGP